MGWGCPRSNCSTAEQVTVPVATALPEELTFPGRKPLPASAPDCCCCLQGTLPALQPAEEQQQHPSWMTALLHSQAEALATFNAVPLWWDLCLRLGAPLIPRVLHGPAFPQAGCIFPMAPLSSQSIFQHNPACHCGHPASSHESRWGCRGDHFSERCLLLKS